MKQLLTLILLFTITNGYGQSLKLKFGDASKMSTTKDSIVPSNLFVTGTVLPIDYGNAWTFNHQSIQARIKANSDTLEILGNAIKFIKIDGKTYEIKRNTELKEVKPNWTVSFGELAIRIDTTLGIRSHNKPKKQ